jgi:hypothetical protein
MRNILHGKDTARHPIGKHLLITPAFGAITLYLCGYGAKLSPQTLHILGKDFMVVAEVRRKSE